MAKQKVKIGFAKSIENIAGGRHNISTVFNDFMKMTICSFSIGFMEEEYKKVRAKYKPEELELFPQALGEMIMEYTDASLDGDWNDIIGNVFETVNSASQASRSGQFFTPKTICDLMARMNMGTDIPTNCADPSCGSSRNLIAHCRLKPEHRTGTFYFASDLDERCVEMSVINYVMYGMKGVVIHMNALTLEVFGGYRIYLPETGLFVKPMTIEQCKYYLFSQKEESEYLTKDKSEPQTNANERKLTQTDVKETVFNNPKVLNVAQQLTLF